jgi:hypothetical protein
MLCAAGSWTRPLLTGRCAPPHPRRTVALKGRFARVPLAHPRSADFARALRAPRAWPPAVTRRSFAPARTTPPPWLIHTIPATAASTAPLRPLALAACRKAASVCRQCAFGRISRRPVARPLAGTHGAPRAAAVLARNRRERKRGGTAAPNSSLLGSSPSATTSRPYAERQHISLPRRSDRSSQEGHPRPFAVLFHNQLAWRTAPSEPPANQ